MGIYTHMYHTDVPTYTDLSLLADFVDMPYYFIDSAIEQNVLGSPACPALGYRRWGKNGVQTMSLEGPQLGQGPCHGAITSSRPRVDL